MSKGGGTNRQPLSGTVGSVFSRSPQQSPQYGTTMGGSMDEGWGRGYGGGPTQSGPLPTINQIAGVTPEQQRQWQQQNQNVDWSRVPMTFGGGGQQQPMGIGNFERQQQQPQQYVDPPTGIGNFERQQQQPQYGTMQRYQPPQMTSQPMQRPQPQPMSLPNFGGGARPIAAMNPIPQVNGAPQWGHAGWLARGRMPR